jgi:uncharacterized protein YuzE
MQISYYSDTDTLYIDLKDVPSVNSVECGEDLVIDLDSNGKITGIEIEHAKEKADLSQLHTEGLHLRRVTYAPITSAADVTSSHPPASEMNNLSFRMSVLGGGGSEQILREMLDKQARMGEKALK